MTTGPGERVPDEATWLDRSGFFPVAKGFPEATDLLNQPRLHADFVGLFKAAGAGSGIVGDVLASSLLSINGDEHKRLRSVVAGDFTPRAAERIRSFAQRSADDLLQDLPTGGTWELIESFAAPFVTRTTCEYVGFDTDEVARCAASLDLIAEAVQDLHGRAHEWDEGITDLVAQATEALRRRREHPTGDVLSGIGAAVDAGEIPELIAVTLVITLLSAGQEPTTFQLGLMVMTLCEHPAVWDGVGSGERALPGVVEEALRYRSTNRGVDRRAAGPFTCAGTRFSGGQRLVIDLAAANHDPRRFAAPEHFDVERNAGSHLAFGFGPHYCLGAALARVQMQEALRSLTTRLHCPEVVDVTNVAGGGLAGPTRLQLNVAAR